MKTFKELLIELKACESARIWAGDMTIEEVVAKCERGDWLLWLAQKIDIGLQPLKLAKGHCANTVRHLMTDKRSIAAIDTAIAYGGGKATFAELKAASDAAYAAYADAYAASRLKTAAYAAAYAADAAAYAAADAAAYAAYADAYAAYADVAAAYAADAASRLKTADICRQYIGQLIIDRVNELLY